MGDKITIIGGGLAGLVNAILLARNGISVTLFEKKTYPFHRVCGEYISNEVVPFLKKESLFPEHIKTSSIRQFEFTSIKGRSNELSLDLGGFGISRYTLDHFLASKAREAGVEVREKEAVNTVRFLDNSFEITSSSGTKRDADFVIGAYGKSGTLDKKLDRGFAKKRSLFIGVKYHIKTDFPQDKIALHNFEGGYCGISAIEDDKFNLCYLGSRESLRKYGSIEAMEKAVVRKNPCLQAIFENSDFLFDKPEVINEFSFRPKSLIENHILMCGDTAGLITPLCGNGMAMAIHSAKILSEIIMANRETGENRRLKIEREYQAQWNATFKHRLWVGRQTQRLFGSKLTSEIAVGLMKGSPWIARKIMKSTHGEPF